MNLKDFFSPTHIRRYNKNIILSKCKARYENSFELNIIDQEISLDTWYDEIQVKKYYSLPCSIILFPLTIAQLIITTFINLIDSIFIGLNILTKNKLKPVFKIFYYGFISIPAILYLITTEAKWFLYNFVQLQPKNQTKFYAYTSVLLTAALTIIALNIANILPLANIALITALLTVLLLAVSLTVKICYKAIHDDQKLHACWPFIALAGIYAGLTILHEAQLINIAFMLHPGAIIAAVSVILLLATIILFTNKTNPFNKLDEYQNSFNGLVPQSHFDLPESYHPEGPNGEFVRISDHRGYGL